MKRGRCLVPLAALALALGVAGCQEKLTAPADCPTLCPGGQAQLAETTLVVRQDSTFPSSAEQGTGYVLPGIGANSSLWMASVPAGVPSVLGTQTYAIVRFVQRDAEVKVKDTVRTVTAVDSAAIQVLVQARDTTVKSVRLQLYRLAPAADAVPGIDYPRAQQALDAGALLAETTLPDTLRSGVVSFKFTGADLAKLPPFPTTGVDTLAVVLAVQSAGGEATGLRIGSSTSTAPPTFTTWLRVAVADTGLQKQSIVRTTAYNTFVGREPLPAATSAVVVGDAPSRRALLRFDLPPMLRDTASIVRATLELTPVTPPGGFAITGLPSDTTALLLRDLIVDIGAKSPRYESDQAPFATAPLAPGSTAPLAVDVTRLVRLWQGTNGRPATLSLSALPEAASFARALLGSSETEAAGGAPAARLRITYARSFPFEAP
ncbi:MAG TPA: hypothetical protein VFS40_02575 [Gemmatimonadales bacterium]|nr:hypothetical protein [Gemmatimonadales bacterium]